MNLGKPQQSRHNLLLVLTAIMLLTLAACSKKEEAPAGKEAAPSAESAQIAPTQHGEGIYLAYSHSIFLEAEDGTVASTFKRITLACQAAQRECLLLNASVSNDHRATSRIQMQIKPERVQSILDQASAGNKVLSQSTSAQDLSKPVQDAQKRQALLKSYQAQLLSLQQAGSKNMGDLVTLYKEIATVQSDIENVSAEKTTLLSRVNWEEVTIEISSAQEQSFWAPLRHTLSSMKQALSESIAALMMTICVILPWLVLLGIVIWGVKKMRARNKRALAAQNLNSQTLAIKNDKE